MNKKILGSAGLTLALLVSACGGGDGDSGSDGGTGGGGEFNIAWNAQPPSMDPAMSTSNATRDITRNIFEPLVTLDADSEVQPVLAEDYEMAEDGASITFTLRDDVTFHDGSAMEVDDVVASVDYWLANANVAQEYFSGSEVSSEDDNSVTMTFAEPVHQAPTLIAHQNQFLAVMPADVIEGASAEGVEDFVGTGPYELGEWATDQHVRLDIFEDYVSPPGESSGTAGEKNPYFDTMFFHFVGDASTRVAGMQSGEYDAAASIPWDNAEMFEGDESVHLEVDGSGFTMPIFNKAEGVMEDQLMREAVMAAIDPEASLQAAFANDEYYSNNGSLLPEDSPLHVEADVELRNSQDLEAAEALLDEAGYDGEEIELITTRDYPQLYNVSVVLQQQLEDLGVNTDMVVADWPTVSNEINNPEGDWDIYVDMVSWTALPNMQGHLAPEGVGSPDDPELSSALQEIVQSEDDEAARAAIADFQDAYYEYLPAAPIGHVTLITALGADYEGYDFVAPSGAIYYNMRDAE